MLRINKQTDRQTDGLENLPTPTDIVSVGNEKRSCLPVYSNGLVHKTLMSHVSNQTHQRIQRRQ